MAINKSKIEQITARSEYFQDILDKIPSKIITWGNTGMLIIFLLMSLLLKIIKYPDAIIADATIINENPSIEVYSRTSGRISNFLKHDQQLVKKDDWVIVLNNSADYIDVIKIEKLVDSLDINHIENIVQTINIDKSLTLGDIQNSYFQFFRTVQELKLYISAKYQDKLSAIYINRQRELVSKRTALVRQIKIGEEQLKISKYDLDRTILLFNQKVLSKKEKEQKEVDYLNVKKSLEDLKTNLINSKLESEQLNTDMTSSVHDRDDNYFKIKNDVTQNYNSLLFQIAEWKSKYVLISPIDGKLDLYDVRNQNQFIANENRLFTITPIISKDFYAISKLPINNSGKVKLHQKCLIKLKNYTYTEYGMLKGEVESISPTAKDGFYLVKMKLPNQLRTNQGKLLTPNGELTGSAEIIIADLSLFDRIFYSLVSKSY